MKDTINSTDKKRRFDEALKELKLRGVSAAKVAKALGRGTTDISRMRNPEHTMVPNDGLIDTLCEVYEIDKDLMYTPYEIPEEDLEAQTLQRCRELIADFSLMLAHEQASDFAKALSVAREAIASVASKLSK